jgi:hypothetical protein
MIESATGNWGGFGFTDPVAINEQAMLAASSQAFADEVDRSSSEYPLTVIQSGPWETMALGFDLADPAKHQWVRIISHSDWNNTHKHLPEHRNKADFDAQYQRGGVFSGVRPPIYQRISDQNSFAFRTTAAGSWDWLDEVGSNTGFVHTRTQASGPAFGDMSDAGMTYFYLTGDAAPTMEAIQAFFEYEAEPPVDPPVDPSFPGLPFEVPNIPEYEVPTIADCEWTVQNGVYTSTLGLPNETTVRDAFRASMTAGHEKPITFGVWDVVGRAIVGGIWNGDADHSITMKDENGVWMTDLSVQFLGLDDSCEVMLGWTSTYGYPEHVGAFNIGLRGPNDSFIIRANSGVDKLLIDGCWWLPSVSFTGNQKHASGMHIDKWKTLVWRNHQFRGVLPSDPGTDLREHSGYLKSCIGTGPEGGTWIVSNNLLGGNRTGFQIRPDNGINPFPKGPTVIAYNVADGFGWNHGSTGETYDGGAVLTVWSNPNDDVFMFGNTITDGKYACMTLSTQSPAKNFLNDNGFPIKSLYLYDNTFENQRGDRGCGSISSIEQVHLYSSTFDGPLNGDLTMDSTWAMTVGGIANGNVSIYGQAYLDYLKGIRVKTHDPNNWSQTIPMPDSQLESYLVPVPPPARPIEPEPVR